MQRYESFGKFTAALPVFIAMIALVLTSGARAGNKYRTLHRFTGGVDGRLLYAGLIFDRAGNLYGTTAEGGSVSSIRDGSGGGTVFKLTPNSDGSWTESVLYKFCSVSGCRDGQSPNGLIFDGEGNLYGTTTGGGNGYGVVYELEPANGGWVETVLYSFAGGEDGADPTSGLIFDSSGNLYGTTFEGGTNGEGMVYQLSPNSGGAWTKKVIHEFTNRLNGASPNYGVISDGKGDLYGMTALGGPGNAGVVYSLKPSKGVWTASVLHRFGSKRVDGAYPGPSGLIIDGVGNLYGTTYRGGLRNFGTVFKLTQSTRTGKWYETANLERQVGGDGTAPVLRPSKCLSLCHSDLGWGGESLWDDRWRRRC